jgi:hypothetical protein
MNKKSKKTTKLTKADLAPENFKTQAENEQAIEDYYNQRPIYNYFQFFIGGPNKIEKNSQEGKPNPPY